MKKVILTGIKGYQKGISPFFHLVAATILLVLIMRLKQLKFMEHLKDL